MANATSFPLIPALDVLAFGAHPDDVELSAGGTLAKLSHQGRRCGVVDLTRGELGTRGSADLRDQEAEEAGKIMGLVHRENLVLADGFFEENQENLHRIISAIRRLQPTVVLANALVDRHPDHGRAAALVARAAFLSGLVKIQTGTPNHPEQPWRPRAVYHYIQDYDRTPDFVVDIAGFVNVKMEAILAYKSQFHDPLSEQPETPISSPEFLEHVKGRATSMGRPVGFKAGEGFESARPLGVDSVLDLF
ncbi:MAG: bacillithiol biosynthesis deacetylase BshB1 [Bacteroidetes bacterium]|nr:bacillithiol biosynthesis deacetylase BshB1 [Bacteroidota bacterium]MDA0903278.1 bacillithiol biosynthesis deacetylase BshB1 [Bacteroidota bacterium]MDA1242163.1 bacillithiol biosynthesis deacetylase BshB1 [Bacteroidota bacterium]